MQRSDNSIEYISVVAISLFILVFFIAVPNRPAVNSNTNWQAESTWLEQLKNRTNEELASLISSAHHESDKLRAVIQEAANRNDSQLLHKLLPLVKHEKDLVKIDIIKILSRPEHSDTKLAKKALTHLLADESFLVRGHAVKALTLSKLDETRLVLTNHLVSEQNEIVYKLIMRSLAEKA